MFFKNCFLKTQFDEEFSLEQNIHLCPLVEINQHRFRLIRIKDVKAIINTKDENQNTVLHVPCFRGKPNSVESDRIYVEGSLVISDDHPFVKEFMDDYQQLHDNRKAYDNNVFVASSSTGELHFLRIDPVHDGVQLVPHGAAIQLPLLTDDYDFRVVYPRQIVTLTHCDTAVERDVILLPGGEIHNFIKRDVAMKPKEKYLIAIRHTETTRFNTQEASKKLIPAIMQGKKRVECYHVVERLRDGGEDSEQGLAPIGMLSDVRYDPESKMLVGYYEPRKRYAYPTHDSKTIFAIFTEGAVYNEGGEFKLTNLRVMVDVGSIERYLINETGNELIRV